MADDINLTTIESKKPIKQTRRTETESWIQRVFVGCQWEWGVGEWVKR